MSLFAPDHTLTIYNPASGTATTRPKAKQLVALLSRRGFHVHHTESPEHATALTSDVLRNDHRAAIVIGGDGTLYEAIALLPPELPLAYFPGGSANLFALNLNLPGQPQAWLDLLEAGATEPIRFGACDNRPFASVASAGFDAHVVARMPAGLKRILNKGAYAMQFFPNLLFYKGPKYKVTVDGKLWEEDCLGVMVGRGFHYGGLYKIFPQADPRGDQLAYAILGGKSKWRVVKFGIGMLMETLPKMEGVTTGLASTIRIEASPEAYVQLDGDLYGTTPVTFSVEGCEREVLVGKEKRENRNEK
jgi:diacylglycerol kinase (ATP)